MTKRFLSCLKKITTDATHISEWVHSQKNKIKINNIIPWYTVTLIKACYISKFDAFRLMSLCND